jgi:hypothetical protein
MGNEAIFPRRINSDTVPAPPGLVPSRGAVLFGTTVHVGFKLNRGLGIGGRSVVRGMLLN